MKKIVNLIVLIAVSLFLSCQEDTVDLVGIGTITGRVVEANSFEPIENAKVSLSPTNNTVFTDDGGYFTIKDVEEGDYSVGATKENYLTTFESATVTAGIEVNVIFEMKDDEALNKAPTTPVLKTPEDGSEYHELSVELTWSSTDPGGDEILYTLQVKNDYDNEILEVLDIADSSYVISDLKYGVKYFWQIAANDGINEEVLSTVNSFRTKINPDNRYLYVKKFTNNNNVIYSASFNEDDAVAQNEVQLTLEELNSWRPRKNQASNRIAFLQTANNATHLFTMKTDGSDVFQVTSAVPVNGHNMNEMDFSWASNGDRLIYSNYDKLYKINKDGSGLQLIYQTSDGSFISECDWSNNESMIALKTNDINGFNVRIYTINMSGDILTTILSEVNGAAGGLNISIDNKLLVYTHDVSGYESSNNRQLDTKIFIYEFATATITDLSINKVQGTNDLDPRFSPNEAEVIFVNTSNDGISTNTIYRTSIFYDSDNNIDRNKMFEDAFMPDWE
ncbi:Carboxypeptidase regulatory-like domain-containing protein [Lutibacter agarilyticus]|uniref:Carboxypeptidase regulatory-like domain-containing protein n=1 Tax=Lutibacter agarilyticus TaxID=1109740 RepID=A0A238YS53_9FLAO|nr:carboxypeptidase regulatory-like domain-containing protein [Lutibacter agarilyticus]SNR73977.1 Carboxypeptidase regulatory-like domain-containing protein [Lutibacter agarilyticus]